MKLRREGVRGCECSRLSDMGSSWAELGVWRCRLGAGDALTSPGRAPTDRLPDGSALAGACNMMRMERLRGWRCMECSGLSSLGAADDPPGSGFAAGRLSSTGECSPREWRRAAPANRPFGFSDACDIVWQPVLSGADAFASRKRTAGKGRIRGGNVRTRGMDRIHFRRFFKSAGPAVLPVIHVRDAGQACRNAAIAIEAGAQGVFLINHDLRPRSAAPDSPRGARPIPPRSGSG